jgi:hypothetical protein
MQRFFKLETVTRRAPLGLRFLDLVRGVSVNDGLLVTARRIGTAGPKQLAQRSPLSGIYSFRTLAGLGRFEVGERPASDWCAPSPPDVGEPTAKELTDIEKLRGLLSADESPLTSPNFIVSVEDQMGRFLPLLMRMCLPREQLVEVPLSSSPARLAPAGLGAVRGQLALHGTQPPQPAAWAVVMAILGQDTYVGVSDARGMFTLFVPYGTFPTPPKPSAKDTTPGDTSAPVSPPQENIPVDQLLWQLNIQVLYQPKKQLFMSELEPPDIRSIMEQGNANIYDQEDTPPDSKLTRFIRFGTDLTVKTLPKPQLFIDSIS